MDQVGVLYQNRIQSLTNDEIFPESHRMWNKEYIKLFNQIKNALPGDQKILMMEFDCVHGAIIGGHEEAGYRLGFGDAFSLSASVMTGRP